VKGLNLGCGTRIFKSTPEIEWINTDAVPGLDIDIVGDIREVWKELPGQFEIIVAHHCFEHLGCGEQPIKQCHEALVPGGSLIVCVPDIKKLVMLWLINEMDTQLFLTNIYGPYDGTEYSRHKWGFDDPYLWNQIMYDAVWTKIQKFDYRQIPGADIARDDRWILALEAVK